MALTQISTQGIKDATITNADIGSSAAIAGSKIDPDFGSQLVASGQVNITSTLPRLRLIDSNNNPSYSLRNNNGTFEVYDDNAPNPRLTIDDSKLVSKLNHDFDAGIDVTGVITGTGDLTIDTNTLHVDSSNNRVGIGTTSPNQLLEVANSSGGATISISTDEQAGSQASKKYNNLDFTGYNNTVMARIQSWDESSSTGHGYLTFFTNKNGVGFTEKLRIDPDGNVGIGTTSPATKLHIADAGSTVLLLEDTVQANQVGVRYKTTTGDWIAGVHGGEGNSWKLANHTAFGTNDYFVVKTSGNVGIGTTTPRTELDLSQGQLSFSHRTDYSIRFYNGNGNNWSSINNPKAADGNATNHSELEFRTASGVAMHMATDGKVGIGLTNPSVKLDVNGATTIRVANSTSYQSGLNVSNSVTTDLQVWIKNNAVALGPSTASEINFVTGGNTGTRLSIAADGEATFSKNIVLEGGSDHAYPHIRLHSSAANVRKWTIYNGQGWNPDALLIYDTDADSTALTIETNKLGVNKGASSLTHNLEVGGSATISGNTAIGTSSPVSNSGYGGLTLNGDNGAIVSFKDSDVEKTRLSLVLNDLFTIQYPPGSSGHLRIDQLTADGSGNITGATERIRVTSDGNTVFTDKDSGHIGGGVYSRTKSCAPGNTNFMKFTLTHGALAGAAYGTASNNARSIAKSYTYAVQFADNSGLTKQSDSGPMGGTDFTIGIDTSSNAHTFKINVTGSHTIEVNLTVIVGCANQDITYEEL